MRPLIGDPPAYDSRTHRLVGPTFKIEPTQVARTWTVEPRDLNELKASLKRQIDAKAEDIRLKYLTPGVGQAQEYVECRREALAVLALPDPAQAAEADYPMITAAIGVSGATVVEVAQTVVATYQAWLKIGAAIRQIRLAAKAAIDAAADVTSAQTAFDAVVWPA